jgi:hypothetical protein
MRRPVVLAIVLFLMSATRPAAAETLRCGSVLIQEGAEASYVLAKCGDPTSKQIIREPDQRARAMCLGGATPETSRDGTPEVQLTPAVVILGDTAPVASWQ